MANIIVSAPQTSNGDYVYSVELDGRCIGSIRECLAAAHKATGDWQARVTKRGKLLSRYYSTKQGAIGFLKRHAKG